MTFAWSPETSPASRTSIWFKNMAYGDLPIAVRRWCDDGINTGYSISILNNIRYRCWRQTEFNRSKVAPSCWTFPQHPVNKLREWESVSFHLSPNHHQDVDTLCQWVWSPTLKTWNLMVQLICKQIYFDPRKHFQENLLQDLWAQLPISIVFEYPTLEIRNGDLFSRNMLSSNYDPVQQDNSPIYLVTTRHIFEWWIHFHYLWDCSRVI